MHYIKIIEKNLNKKAIIVYKNMQKGDIKDTLSDLRTQKNTFLINQKLELKRV